MKPIPTKDREERELRRGSRRDIGIDDANRVVDNARLLPLIKKFTARGSALSHEASWRVSR